MQDKHGELVSAAERLEQDSSWDCRHEVASSIARLYYDDVLQVCGTLSPSSLPPREVTRVSKAVRVLGDYCASADFSVLINPWFEAGPLQALFPLPTYVINKDVLVWSYAFLNYRSDVGVGLRAVPVSFKTRPHASAAAFHALLANWPDQLMATATLVDPPSKGPLQVLTCDRRVRGPAPPLGQRFARIAKVPARFSSAEQMGDWLHAVYMRELRLVEQRLA